MLYLKPSSSISYLGVNGVNAPPHTPLMFCLSYFFASDFLYFISHPFHETDRQAAPGQNPRSSKHVAPKAAGNSLPCKEEGVIRSRYTRTSPEQAREISDSRP